MNNNLNKITVTIIGIAIIGILVVVVLMLGLIMQLEKITIISKVQALQQVMH